MREQTVTATDVARAASVSRVTVSRVLNNHDNVTDAVRQRVLKAATELGYIAQRGTGAVAGRLVTPLGGASAMQDIGFLFCSVLEHEIVRANPFWSQLLGGVERAATAANIRITYRSIDRFADSPQALLRALSDARLNGLLLVGPTTERAIWSLETLHLPMVLVDNYLRDVAIDAVLSDNIEGARLATEHLIAIGHQQIAFLGGPIAPSRPSSQQPTNLVYTIEQRAMGYRNALREAGIVGDDQLFEAGDLTADGGYAACNRLIERGVSFTALCCANDETAIGAMRALHEAGRRVPGDVSVVGFDDIEVTKHLTPPLTTIHVDKEAMGASALQMLLARAQEPEAPPVTMVLRVELVQRGSVAPPAHRSA